MDMVLLGDDYVRMLRIWCFWLDSGFTLSLPRLPCFRQSLVRCLRRSTSSGKFDFLGDEFPVSSYTALYARAECRELAERMIVPFVIGSNSVVRRLPPTLAHTRFGATVFHGDCPHPRSHAFWSNSVVWTSRSSAAPWPSRLSVPHSGPQGLARSSQCLQLAFRRNSFAWTSMSSAALCCSRLSRQVRALRIERSLNE